ncbi:hypothetical protein LOTGIDRAFT_228644 [Lottia gigantea]|uniref:Hexosyltransferase n=1 Tax=Lottia gigantea TaxID=225164 RepID=V4AAY1_LOTGI|nr:hypothetical protein LOTGIDRAFT_228644 [Lottia gigantea]ESO93937.1 hypothetical protein LOTGIDRAFT_228644 [Lottia gigantea]
MVTITTAFTRPQQVIIGSLLAAIFLLAYSIFTLNVQSHVDISFGNLRVDAIYKHARQLADGSVELTLNIPSGSVPLSKSHILALSVKDAKADAEKKTLPKDRKTSYPLTINSPYVINSPDVCKNVKNLAFITIVHTATDHFDRRRLIRETFANKDLFKNVTSRIVFVFGLSPDITVQTLLENEQTIHGDIVQGDFLDTYHNLTHKGVLAFRWVSEYCNHSKLVVKIDDDMFLNPFSIVQDIIPKYANKKRFMLCHLRSKGTSGIMRGKKYKWHVENDQFKGYKSYPVSYCNGYFVIISPEIISPMYRASSFTPFFWVDDVYLYGLLPSKIGHVVHENIRGFLTLNMNHGIKCYAAKTPCPYIAVNAWQTTAVENLWRSTLEKLTKEQRALVNDRFLIT